MAKWLLVGDPHVVAEELDDCEGLLKGILQAVDEEKPDFVCFMGDQHHNHALVHLEVMAFWRRAFTAVASRVSTFALVGNHDMAGDGVSKSHALLAYQGIPGLQVVDQAVRVGDIKLIPYRHQQEDFIRDVLCSPEKKILCHQTFDGSKYENGFFAQDGVKLEGMEDRFFVSGHIHTPQSFANVTYIGAPRWRTVSDVGINRALVLVELGGQSPQFLKLIDTSRFCRKLVQVIDRQEEPAQVGQLDPNWRYIVDIHGDEAFIKARRPVWAGCRIRSFKTRTTTKPVGEAMGIGKALSVFLESYRPKFGTEPAILRGMVAQRLGIT